MPYNSWTCFIKETIALHRKRVQKVQYICNIGRPTIPGECGAAIYCVHILQAGRCARHDRHFINHFQNKLFHRINTPFFLPRNNTSLSWFYSRSVLARSMRTHLSLCVWGQVLVLLGQGLLVVLTHILHGCTATTWLDIAYSQNTSYTIISSISWPLIRPKTPN